LCPAYPQKEISLAVTTASRYMLMGLYFLVDITMTDGTEEVLVWSNQPFN
jgi:hypothetical protein